MIEKLMLLHIGSRLRRQGKVYTVRYVKNCGGKLCRRDMGLLEDGKPETFLVEGRYHAAGRMLEFSNVQHCSWYARKEFMDFEIINDEMAA